MDRVLLYEKKCLRNFPICLQWDNDSLRARERDEIKSGGFGFGRELPPIKLGSSLHDDIEENETEGAARHDNNSESIKDATDKDAYATKLILHAKETGSK